MNIDLVVFYIGLGVGATFIYILFKIDEWYNGEDNVSEKKQETDDYLETVTGEILKCQSTVDQLKAIEDIFDDSYVSYDPRETAEERQMMGRVFKVLNHRYMRLNKYHNEELNIYEKELIKLYAKRDGKK